MVRAVLVRSLIQNSDLVCFCAEADVITNCIKIRTKYFLPETQRKEFICNKYWKAIIHKLLSKLRKSNCPFILHECLTSRHLKLMPALAIFKSLSP